jgi:hypothetical protein
MCPGGASQPPGRNVVRMNETICAAITCTDLLPADIMCVDGAALTVRAIDLGDVDRLAATFGRLSRESVRTRFFSPIPRLPWPTLLRLADVDHCRREALVALDGDEIVAVAPTTRSRTREWPALRRPSSRSPWRTRGSAEESAGAWRDSSRRSRGNAATRDRFGDEGR